MYDGIVQDLIDEFGRLPGIGPKSAQRIAFHILQTQSFDVSHLAELLTEKGRALRALAPDAFAAGDADKEARLATLPAAFDAAALREKLDGLFDHPVWAEQSLRCLGCGACAYVCPTCACLAPVIAV